MTLADFATLKSLTGWAEFDLKRRSVDPRMSTLMMPAATMTTMTNTSPIAVTQQPKAGSGSNGSITGDPTATKMGIINNNKQGRNQTPETVSTYIPFLPGLSSDRKLLLYEIPIRGGLLAGLKTSRRGPS